MRKIDFEPKHVRELNRELEFERKGKLIYKTVATLILTIMVIGPTVLLVILNADWIDKVFGYWQVQFGFFVLVLAVISYIYILWRINR